ncbi:MAG: flippase [Cyanobacteria bacterium J06598_3]
MLNNARQLKRKILKSKIVKGIVGSFGLRLAYTGLTFTLSIVLARVLGTAGFGTYSYAVVWAFLLSVPATLGFDNLVVREIAVYQSQSSWPLMRGLLRWADRSVLAVAIPLAIVAMLIAWLLDGGAYSEPFIGFCLAMVLMPAISLRNVRRGAMRGLQQITKGLLPELLIDPMVLLVLTGGAFWLWPQRLSPLWVIVFYGVGTGLTLLLSHQFLQQSLPADVKLAVPEIKGKAWLKAALPFILIESIPVINARTDVLMLGSLRGVEAVGLYVPVNRGAQLITFILVAVGGTIAPTIASTYANGQMIDLQRLVTKSVRVITGVAFLFAVALIILGNRYLSLFGPEFVLGRRALFVLCIGTFISTALGLSYLVLNMTGHERFTALMSWFTTVLNVVLNAVLIPLWGVEGAALATSSSLVIGSFISLIAVRQKLGIDGSLMGLPFNRF